MFSNPSFIWNVTHNCKLILRSMFQHACASFNVRLRLKDWSSGFHHALVYKWEIWDSMKQVNIRQERASYLLFSRSNATCATVICAHCNYSTRLLCFWVQSCFRRSTYSTFILHVVQVLSDFFTFTSFWDWIIFIYRVIGTVYGNDSPLYICTDHFIS